LPVNPTSLTADVWSDLGAGVPGNAWSLPEGGSVTVGGEAWFATTAPTSYGAYDITYTVTADGDSAAVPVVALFRGDGTLWDTNLNASGASSVTLLATNQTDVNLYLSVVDISGVSSGLRGLSVKASFVPHSDRDKLASFSLWDAQGNEYPASIDPQPTM